MSIQLLQADLNNAKHSADFLDLLNQYACDIVGGGKDLSDFVKANLVQELRKRPNVYIILAYDEDRAVGLAVCFEGFSTFYAKPLMNIHDFVVSENYRGKGIAKLLLEKTEEIAASRGCCKITLEVLEGNVRAQKIYRDFGFAGYELDDKMGKALFWEKKI